MIQLNSVKKNNIAHIILIIFGSAFFLSGSFQTSLWFDEAYTVGLMHNSFFNMLKWSAGDVHPHLYYIMLWLFTRITGTSLIAMRIFSAIGGILLGLLGFTHIKKDFGEKTGFWFSFVCYSFTGVFYYTIQIRMYTWAALFVTLAAIYAYRITYKDNSLKNRIIFIAVSVAAAYTHYFALFAICAINVMLLVKLLRDKSKLKDWLVNGILQIILYMPGLLVFLHQIMLGGADWIKVEFPNVFFDISIFHFTGDVLSLLLEGKSYSNLYSFIGICCFTLYFAILMKIFLIAKKNKYEYKPFYTSLCAYFSVILCTIYVSMVRPIYSPRYTITIIGYIVFSLAFIIARLKKNVYKAYCVVVLTSIMAFNAGYIYYDTYDKSNMQIDTVIKPSVTENDIFLLEEFDQYVVSVRFPENQVCFYNRYYWNVWDAYRAFGKDSVIVGEMEDGGYAEKTGRFWVSNNGYWYDYINSFEGTKVIDSKKIYLKYHDYTFDLVLLEKTSTIKKSQE